MSTSEQLQQCPAGATYGRATRNERFRRWLYRRKFIFLLLITGSILPVLVLFAFYDFVTSAKQQEDDARVAALRSEIAQFALYLGDDNGSILLDNAKSLSKTRRPLTPLIMRRPFFTYFLNRANGNSFDPARLSWEMPKGCALDFPLQGVPEHSSRAVRVCLVQVPNEAVGRYIYLALRYPTSPSIARHVQGQSLRAADNIRLEFISDRARRMQLVFEPTTLASERYPSQKRRFSTIHAVTAYPIGDFGQPLRGVSGQAFEQQVEDDTGRKQNIATVLVRIEESLVSPLPSSTDITDVVKLSIVAHKPSPNGFDGGRIFQIPIGANGLAATSLERLYEQTVQSKAKLQIMRLDSPPGPIWSSDLDEETASRDRKSWIQSMSNQWVAFIGKFFGFNLMPSRAAQALPSQNVVVTVQADSTVLPEIATRAFLFLSLTLGFVFILTISGGVVIYQFRKISRVAYMITAFPSSNASLEAYRKRTDEIGAFGRTFDLLIRRHRARNARLVMRAEQEAREQRDSARIEREQVKTQQAILDAIGHEIRSPLNNLMSRALAPDINRDLMRMERAVNALYFANSVESGLRSGKYVIARADLGDFLGQFVDNMAENVTGLVYDGPTSGVISAFDDLILTQVMEHLCDNALRYRLPNTEIRVRLSQSDERVEIDVANVGSSISADRLESIFDLGVSTEDEQRNFGIGLFAARIYIAAMKGSIIAVNRPNGVSFVIDLPNT